MRKRIISGKKMKKYCIISAFSNNYRSLMEITSLSIKKFGHKNSIDVIIEEIINYDRPYSWYKIKLILDLLKNNQYEYILWIDTDATILNTNYSLDSFIKFDKYFYVSKDINGINCGVIMIENNDYIINFLTQVYSMTQYLHDGWWEQKAIHDLININYNNINEYIEYIPQNIWNAYDYKSYNIKFDGNVCEKTFIFHTPGMPLNNRISKIQEKLKQYSQ